MKPERLSNPALAFISDDWEGNPIFGGRFANGDVRERSPTWKALRWLLSPNPQRREKRSDTSRLDVVDDGGLFTAQGDFIIWLGHATFLIRLAGVTLLTDPVFVDSRLLRRKAGLACAPEELRGIDYLLLSHGHRDHLDLGSLRRLQPRNPEMVFLTPLAMGGVLRRLGDIRLQEAGWYQRYRTPGIEVDLLPARHWHRRGLRDFNRILWGSFLIRSPQHTLYFAGDSAYGDHFSAIAQTVGGIDTCLMPIGAYKPLFIMQESHLAPAEAVTAFHDLRGRTLVPMHYGTYDLSDEPLGEPLREIRRLEAQGSIAGTLRVLKIGEVLRLD